MSIFKPWHDDNRLIETEIFVANDYQRKEIASRLFHEHFRLAMEKYDAKFCVRVFENVLRKGAKTMGFELYFKKYEVCSNPWYMWYIRFQPYFKIYELGLKIFYTAVQKAVQNSIVI